jgi:hypothetical protein
VFPPVKYEGDEERPRRERATASSEDVLEQIKQQYEPSLLAEKFITTEDERIRRTDIPERLQVAPLPFFFFFFSLSFLSFFIHFQLCSRCLRLPSLA